LVFLIGLILPACKFKNALLSLFPGISVHPSAIVGHTVLLGVSELTLESGAVLGDLNIVRGLTGLRLGSGAVIGGLNSISSSAAFSSLPDDGFRGRLHLKRDSALTNRHYLDCSGGIEVGEFTTIAGCRSTILTHQIDLRLNSQVLSPVTFGRRCFISSNVSVVPGAHVADRIVVAMGAVIKGSLDLAGGLYGGVPARYLKMAENEGYASRSRGPTEIGS